ncbi:oligosaccharide flippase family protein [Ferroplasma sp.]|uniref:oligosaccharide flippase family protein n=1 Tax=Ferroplasma sp. TaxID=2591003 RepID=UPI00262ECC97|nr:oligosaccharide flippase family protein [Ferroplasma sp.]
MGDITESFGSGVAFQYSAVASMFLSSTIFYFFIAHLLPVDTVGSISLLYAIMNIMTTVFVFGLSFGIQHYFSYHLARKNNNTLLKLIKKTVLIGLVLTILAFLSIYYASPYIAILFFHSINYELSIKIIGIAIANSVMVNILASILLGLNQYKRYSLIYVFFYTFLYFFPLSLLFLYGKSIYLIAGIAIINTVGTLIFSLYVYKIYKRLTHEDTNYERESYKKIIYYSIPLFFSSIMGTSATYLDRIVVSYFINLSYLGIYNFALIIASAAAILIAPISNLLIPKLSSFFSLDNKIAFRASIRILLNIVSLIYIPAALGIAALSKPLLYFFAGSVYEVAYIPLMIIMFVTALFIGSTVLSPGISSIRKTNIFVISSGLSLLANLILSVILIPRFSIIGAGISYSSMNVINFIILYHYARKFDVVNYDKNRIIKIWISSLIMFSFVFTLQGYLPYSLLNIFIWIMAGLLIYIAEIKVFKLISIDEMDYALSIIPDKFGFLKYIMKNLAFHDKKIKNDKLFRFFK